MKIVERQLSTIRSPVHAHSYPWCAGPATFSGARENRTIPNIASPFSSSPSLYPRLAAAFALRQRMMNFVQNLQYYMAFEVQGLWKQ